MIAAFGNPKKYPSKAFLDHTPEKVMDQLTDKSLLAAAIKMGAKINGNC